MRISKRKVIGFAILVHILPSLFVVLSIIVGRTFISGYGFGWIANVLIFTVLIGGYWFGRLIEFLLTDDKCE